MNAITIDIVAPMLSCLEFNHHGFDFLAGSLGLKDKDRKTCIYNYPEDWKEAVDYLSCWIDNLNHLYRHRIYINLIDAQSPLGLWKQLRHRVFRFPAFIVDGKNTYIGWDYQELETIIDERMGN